jgi:hypothetical protein
MKAGLLRVSAISYHFLDLLNMQGLSSRRLMIGGLLNHIISQAQIKGITNRGSGTCL